MTTSGLAKPEKTSLGARLRYWIFSGGIPVDTIPHEGPSYLEAVEAKGHGRSDEYFGQIPDAIPTETIRELSVLSPMRSVFYIALGWAYIVAAIWLCMRFWHPAVYVLMVLFLGARIHGMMMIMHDASHYRLFHSRTLNDFAGELLLSWPFFISMQRYRAFHFLHHHHLGEERDGNRILYLTHTTAGELTADWVFPKTALQFGLFLLKRFLAGPVLALYITWINYSEAYFVWTGQPQKAWLIGRYRKPTSKTYVTLHVLFSQGDCELGHAFDGDGDRLGVVTPAGNVIYADRQLMLFAADVLARVPGATVIYDVKSTRNLKPWIERHGGVPLLWKTGHSLIKAKMKEVGAALAGEMSGHTFFGERWYGFDDGLYAGARLLEILARHPDPAAVLDALPNAVSTPELNIPCAEGEQHALIEKLQATADFPGASDVIRIDGLRVEYPDGFGLARASNTTPMIVLRFEADDAAALARASRMRFAAC
jgi:hypothetical protein